MVTRRWNFVAQSLLGVNQRNGVARKKSGFDLLLDPEDRESG